MAREDILVGLEIGTSKVCAVVAEARRDSTMKILGVGVAQSCGVRKGEIVDFDTAGKCVREALADAEEKSDVEIHQVFLSVTGSHIKSFNKRGAIDISPDQEEIRYADLEEVRTVAGEVSLPQANTFVHTLLQHYYIDGQDGVLNPEGMMGSKLEADYHIVHGVRTRIQNNIRCVRELNIGVDDVVFAPVAAAEVIIDPSQRELGGLVIDLGGGTTGYSVFTEGAIKRSGCIAVGGDHVTNDISLGLRLPMARAERLKVEEGGVLFDGSEDVPYITLKDEAGFVGCEVEREHLNNIIYCRLRETFELVKRDLDEGRILSYLGAGVMLTGGGSLIRGIDQLASEVFGLPVRLTRPETVSGITSHFEDPTLSTAIGVTKYAQSVHAPKQEGWLKSTLRRFKSFGG